MKASAQYNDFVGTAAADLRDHSDIMDFAKKLKLDTVKYKPIGFSLYSGEIHFSVSLICEDKMTGELVKVVFEDDPSVEDTLKLFKRLNVVMTKEQFAEEECNKEITVDNR